MQTDLLETPVKEIANLKAAALDEHTIVSVTYFAGENHLRRRQVLRDLKILREELIGQDHQIINSAIIPRTAQSSWPCKLDTIPAVTFGLTESLIHRDQNLLDGLKGKHQPKPFVNSFPHLKVPRILLTNTNIS
jgi:hypothetical protein